MKAMWLALAAVVAAPPGVVERRLGEAKLSLAEAVEKGAKEGTPVGARLVEEKERLVYRVRVAKGEETTAVSFDARGGELLAKVVEKKSASKAVALAKLSVAQATAAALKKAPGKAYGVKLELEKGKAVYEIRVLVDGKRRELEIDATTGDVLDDDEDDDDDDEEEEDDDEDEEDDDD